MTHRLPDPLRFYVAGKVGGGEDMARLVADRLMARGWQWSLDWTSVPVAVPYLGHVEQNRAVAEGMRRAAASSDLVVLVAGERLLGALIEVGVALGAGADVAIFGRVRESVFWCLPEVRLLDDLEALEVLAERIEARAGL